MLAIVTPKNDRLTCKNLTKKKHSGGTCSGVNRDVDTVKPYSVNGSADGVSPAVDPGWTIPRPVGNSPGGPLLDYVVEPADGMRCRVGALCVGEMELYA